MRRFARIRALVSPALLAALVAAPALADELAHKDIDFSSTGATRLKKASGVDGVEVSGGNNEVRLRFGKALAKGGDKAAVSSFSVGLRHVDKGTHGFSVAFGKVGKVEILCDEKPAAGVKILCDERPATFTPVFAGASTYSVKVLKNGTLIKSLSGQKGSFTIGNFDTAHDGHQETIGLKIAHGAERKGAWSMTITHEAFVITITADGTQKLDRAAAELSVKTSGLEAMTLTEPLVSTAAIE